MHRLDTDTSGILIVPRTNHSLAQFSTLFQEKAIKKTYYAFVKGHPDKSGIIEDPIGRDPIHRHKMTSRPDGKPSLTKYTVEEYYEDSALLKVHPVTGRTHQIRVHCTALGHPLLGDTTYGSAHPGIKRQALHAHQLSFTYKKRWYSFSYALPEDMHLLQKKLTQIFS